MSLAKKLREVVAANFIEIARVDTPPVKPEETIAPIPPTPASLTTSAEAELDSFLKDIGASPVVEASPVSVPEPEPIIIAVPEPEIIAPTPVLVSLIDAVSDDGDIDFIRVFQQYELPTASFSAEQAMNMLQALPRDLALRTKRVTVNTTLSAIGKVVGATPKDIIDDAARKKETLNRFVEALDVEVEETTAITQGEIERLQAEISTHKEYLRALSRKRSAATEVSKSRMELLDQVISFFDYDENSLNAPEPVVVEDHSDPEELPAFMREDTARNILGIQENFTDENGVFDLAKFAEKYGDGTDENKPEDGDEPGTPARRPRSKR